MPELPEVETLRIQLSQLLPGLIIKDIEILKTKSFTGDKKLVTGKKIKEVRRFAKILVIDLSNGLSLAVHLKMSGQLIYKQNGSCRSSIPYKCSKPIFSALDGKPSLASPVLQLPNKHTRVIFSFTNGDSLFFNDMRMFGWIRIVRNNPITQLSNNPINEDIKNINDLIGNLGPEPLRDLTLNKFKEILGKSNRPIKLVLMDQEKISGVGNIYTNDSLFLTRVHPRTRANVLSVSQAAKLFDNLLIVLKAGIKYKGASRNNFRDAFGAKGEMQDHFYVYDRAGKTCPNNCGEKIKKIKLGGRGTFFCPKCQK